MKTDKYRIIKITLGDKTNWYEVQEKSWFGKWITCQMIDPAVAYDFKVPAQFEQLEDAERFVARNLVSPIVEVVKEY